MSTIRVTAEVKREIDRYRQFMLEHEYTALTAIGYGTYLSRFLRQPARSENCPLRQSINVFLEEQRECNPENHKECRAALHLYFKTITGEKFPKHTTSKCTPEIEAVLQRFYDCSVNIKRIRPNSAMREIVSLRGFLKHITANVPFRFEDITAHNIREYVINRFSHLKDSSKGREVTALRNFFRFQKFEGISVHESVFLLPLSPAVWKNSAFPTTMDEDVFDSLYEVPDKNTPTGKRNRCIILCFTELALRCIEVAALTVDDFNWHEGCVSIKNTKTHEDRKLPISAKLGGALVEYLNGARPSSADRTLFVRFKHVCGEPMGASQIRGVVRRIYAKSGADITSTGTHILRRTAGSRIYNAGNSLKMTADILGHESVDSTALYVKADTVGPRRVAAPWPCATEKAGVCDGK